MNSNNKVKIFLRGAYNSFNLGDDLLLFGALGFLKELKKKEKRKLKVYIHKGQKSFWKLNFPYTLPLFSSAASLVHQWEKEERRLSQSAFWFRRFRKIVLVFKIGLKLLFPFWSFPEIRFYRSLDIVWFLGGAYLNSFSRSFLYLEYFNLVFAKRVNFKLKVIGSGMQWGPFRSRFDIWVAKRMAFLFDKIIVRDKKSFALLRSWGAKVELGEDDLWLGVPFFKQYRSVNKKGIALNLRFRSGEPSKKQKQDLKKFLLSLPFSLSRAVFFSLRERKSFEDWRLLAQIDLPSLKIVNPYKVGWRVFVQELSSKKEAVGGAFHFILLALFLGLRGYLFFTDAYYCQKYQILPKLRVANKKGIKVGFLSPLDSGEIEKRYAKHRVHLEKIFSGIIS